MGCLNENRKRRWWSLAVESSLDLGDMVGVRIVIVLVVMPYELQFPELYNSE